MPNKEFPWSPGTATGIGSLPGTDIAEAVRTVYGELPDLPYLPELPARGPGADMVGRTAGMLVDLPVELYVARWRVASHVGRDLRRTRDLLERDVDEFGVVGVDFTGPVKVQATGPWTLAASLDLSIGGPMLRDPGAVRDLVASLAEGLAAHVRAVASRLPHARILVQLDEPSLPAVLVGRIPTESGYGTLRAVEVSVARTALAAVVDAVGVPVVVHCCASDAPVGLFREAGATGVALDLDLVTDIDGLGEVLDAGLGLFAGVGGSDEPEAVGAAAAGRIRDLWRKIGFSVNDLAAQVVVTPACGLAGSTPERARDAMAMCRQAARRLSDD